MHLPAPVKLCFPLIVTHHQKLSANRSRWLNLDVRAADTGTVRTVFAGRDGPLEEENSEHHEYESLSFRFRSPREDARRSRRRKYTEAEDLSSAHGQTASNWAWLKCLIQTDGRGWRGLRIHPALQGQPHGWHWGVTSDAIAMRYYWNSLDV